MGSPSDQFEIYGCVYETQWCIETVYTFTYDNTASFWNALTSYAFLTEAELLPAESTPPAIDEVEVDEDEVDDDAWRRLADALVKVDANDLDDATEVELDELEAEELWW